MCWKKKLPTIAPAKKRLLSFAINDYPGSQNDLNGCLNDQTDLINRLNKDFPGFDIRKFSNSQVTTETFISELDGCIAVLRPGDLLVVEYSGHGTQVNDTHGDETDGYDEAIYTYNGPVVDDRIRQSLSKILAGMVVLIFDSCFSRTIDKDICNHKIRFMRMPGTIVKHHKVKKMTGEEKGYIVFSGCEEWQTSADALIGGRYNGALHYYWLGTLQVGMTYQEWITALKKKLPNKNYDQIPSLDGDKDLFAKVVFS
jgi:hypothetical protein